MLDQCACAFRPEEQLLQRKNAEQTAVLVDHIDRVNVVHLLGLLPHLNDRARHGGIRSHGHQFLRHERTGGAFLIAHQFLDVLAMLLVLEQLDHLALLLLGKLRDHVRRIVGIDVFQHILGDLAAGERAQQTFAHLLIELQQHFCRLLMLQQAVHVHGLLIVQPIKYRGDVRCMQLGQHGLHLLIAALLDILADIVQHLFGELEGHGCADRLF